MEILIKDAVVAKKAIESIKGINLPPKTSFKLGRLLDKLLPIVERYEVTKNNLIVDEFGVPDAEEKGKFTVPPTNLPEFLKALDSILGTKEDIGNFDLIKIDDFGTTELPVSFFKDMSLFITE